MIIEITKRRLKEFQVICKKQLDIEYIDEGADQQKYGGVKSKKE